MVLQFTKASKWWTNTGGFLVFCFKSSKHAIWSWCVWVRKMASISKFFISIKSFIGSAAGPVSNIHAFLVTSSHTKYAFTSIPPKGRLNCLKPFISLGAGHHSLCAERSSLFLSKFSSSAIKQIKLSCTPPDKIASTSDLSEPVRFAISLFPTPRPRMALPIISSWKSSSSIFIIDL